MAASVQSQPQLPNGTAPNFKIVQKLETVPVVHDSVAYAEHLIKSTQLTQNLYQVALNIAQRGVEVASPIITRAKPLLDSADGLAVATFDRVESTFPAIMTPTQDFAGVKQAKAVYDQRVLPLLQQASPVIQEVVNKTAAINSQLGATAHAAINKSSDISHALVAQLHALAEQGKELPHQLIEGLGKVTEDVKSIVLAKDGTVQEKTNKLGAYVIDQVKPIVDEIYRHVLGATKSAEDKVAKVANEVSEKPAAKEAAQKVDQAKASVSKAADKAANQASEKVNQASAQANKAADKANSSH